MINRPFFQVLSFLISIVVVSACVSTSVEPSSSNELAPQKETRKKILVINSNRSIERYQIAESTYTDSLSEYPIKVINLENEQEPIEYLQDELNQGDYELIYCIGAKALGSIDYLDPSLPVVYTAVLNWRKFESRKNYFGISSELSPQVQLTWFKYFFPEINNIGVFYSAENEYLINDARKASKNLSLNLMPVQIRSDDQLLLSAQSIFSDIDVLWLISDSSIISSIKNVESLFNIADQQNMPVITYNPHFVAMGAIMGLVADLPTTARQAALITVRLLEKQTIKQTVQFPAGSRIIINSRQLKRHKMKLDSGVLDSVDEVR